MEMSPSTWRLDRALRIYEENYKVIASLERNLLHGLAKVSICLPTAAAGDYAESALGKPEFLEELLKPAAASGGIVGMFVVTGALDIDTDTHQRLPPISPLRHRRPRL